MTGVFDTTPAALVETAADCDKTAEYFFAELKALETYVRSFEGQWIGVTSVSFEGTMNDYNTRATALNHALVSIAAGLRDNANNYKVGEQDNTRLITGAAGDYQPANLGTSPN